jgi:signal transduction histidine kinase
MRKLIILLLLGLSGSVSSFAQSGRLNDLQEALALSTKRSYDNVLEQIASAMDTLDFYTAQKECLETIEIAHTLKYQRLALPQAYDILANICKKHNHPDLALEHYLKITEFYEIANYKKALAHTYFRIGLLHFNAKHYGQAQRFLQKALKTAQDSLESRQVINAYNAIALCYKDVNNYPLAVKNFDTALGIAQKAQDSVFIGVIYSNIASVHYEKKEYQQALHYFQHGLRMNLAYQGEEGQIANIYNALGNTYLKTKQIAPAKECFENALPLAKKSNALLAFQEAYQGLAHIYEFRNDFTKAYQYHALLKQMSDSINLKNKHLAILEMQHRFDTERKDNQILLLHKDAENHQFQRISFVLGSGTLLLLTFFFIRNYFKERRNNILLKTQNQQINQHREEIHTQTQQLTQLNNTKDKLFSIISHDLRSPLSSLNSALALLQTQNISQVDFQRIISELRKNLDNVHFTLENLLQWSYTQMSGIKINVQLFDIKEVTDEIIALYETNLQDKEIVLANLVRGKTLVKADKNQIRLIIRNLVANAIKFTNHGGKITLNTEVRGNWVIFSVADTGVGMEILEAEQLFEQTTHFTKRGTANEKGTGLGLILCKEFVEKNGGQIWLKSKVGEGTIFYFSLPCIA